MVRILITGTPGTGKTSLAKALSNKYNFKHLELSRMIEESDNLFCTDDIEGDDQGRDTKRNCSIFDEEKVLDAVEDIVRGIEQDKDSEESPMGSDDSRTLNGNLSNSNSINSNSQNYQGIVIDFHSANFLLEGIHFDIVIVLRTNIEELGRRLEARNYGTEKIRENVECEIFQILTEEVRDFFIAEGEIDENMMENGDASGDSDSNNLPYLELQSSTSDDSERNMQIIGAKLNEIGIAPIGN